MFSCQGTGIYYANWIINFVLVMGPLFANRDPGNRESGVISLRYVCHIWPDVE